MEAEGAVVVWNRSVELHNIRYKWMMSDCDSKAFNALENAYADCKVIKLDCVVLTMSRREWANTLI